MKMPAGQTIRLYAGKTIPFFLTEDVIRVIIIIYE